VTKSLNPVKTEYSASSFVSRLQPTCASQPENLFSGNDKIKVLYITGWGRSGSTVLDKILGQLDGFFSVGELRYLWDRGLIENRLCGCGTPFTQCEVWQQILEEAFGGIEKIEAQEMVRLRESIRTRHTLLGLMPAGKRLLSARTGKYLHVLEKLYRSIQSTTGSRVIVDSSKFPSHGYVLGMIPAIDLHIVHLVRDSRAVSFSWLKKKVSELSANRITYVNQHGPLRSSWLWSTWNMTAETLWRGRAHRYLIVRYEDFIRRPREAVERVLDLVQEKTMQLPFSDEHKVDLEKTHTVAGNPNRFQNGTVNLRLDEEWKEKMKRRHKTMVTMLTWPLLRRYGYLA
jgi:hypothetical protein